MSICQHWQGKPLVHQWEYKSETGETLGYVARYELKACDGQKDIIPYFKQVGGNWVSGGPDEPKPLFGLDLLARKPDTFVCVVEGEKAAAALHQLGWVAVTSLGGSQSACRADWKPLKGKVVALFPDNDEAGAEYIAVVAAELVKLGVEPRVCELGGLPPKGDVVDWIQARLPNWDGYSQNDQIASLKGELFGLVKESKPVDQSSTDGWGKLIPLDEFELPSLDVTNLPTWVGDYIKSLSAATETPIELAAGMVLAACAAATARRAKVMVSPGYFEPCNLWVLVALPPGNRKSAVQTAAIGPLNAWQTNRSEELEPEIQRIISERKTMEARANEFRKKAARTNTSLEEAEAASEEAAQIEGALPEVPVRPLLWTSDATPEQLGVLLVEQGERVAWMSSEGGIFDMMQGRYSGGIPNLDLMLKAHSGDPDRVDRGCRPSVNLRYPLLTIGLSPQPEVLRGLASKPGFRGRGFLGRFLYLLPSSPLGYRTLRTQPVPDSVSRAYSSGLKAMLDWKPSTDKYGRERLCHIKLSQEAHSEWFNFAQKIEKQMRPDSLLENVTDWAGKAPGAAARLAGVLHCIEYAHGKPWQHEITAKTMSTSVEILTLISHHSLAALDLMGADQTIAGARHVWDWIKRGRRPLFTVSEAFNALKGRFPRVKFVKEALQVLQERGYVEVLPQETNNGPGRPPSPPVMVRPDIVASWR